MRGDAEDPIWVFRHCPLGCGPKLQTHVCFVPGFFLRCLCRNCSRGQARDSVNFGR